jgi:hypothetical protein
LTVTEASKEETVEKEEAPASDDKKDAKEWRRFYPQTRVKWVSFHSFCCQGSSSLHKFSLCFLWDECLW